MSEYDARFDGCRSNPRRFLNIASPIQNTRRSYRPSTNWRGSISPWVANTIQNKKYVKIAQNSGYKRRWRLSSLNHRKNFPLFLYFNKIESKTIPIIYWKRLKRCDDHSIATMWWIRSSKLLKWFVFYHYSFIHIWGQIRFHRFQTFRFVPFGIEAFVPNIM